MSLEELLKESPWQELSTKLQKAIERPYHVGFFSKEEADAKNLRLVIGREGFLVDGNALAFYWLVDEEDGIIADVRFQAFGDSALIGLVEGTCRLLIGKNYDQIGRFSAELIEKELRDQPSQPALPEAFRSHLNLILCALDVAVDQCTDLPLPTTYVSPIQHEALEAGEPYPGWEELSQEEKLAIIEQLMNEEVRPYVEMDAGGVDLISIDENNLLKIAYKGNCTSCFSAIGSTLSSIQEILVAKIHPDIRVEPDMESLSL